MNNDSQFSSSGTYDPNKPGSDPYTHSDQEKPLARRVEAGQTYTSPFPGPMFPGPSIITNTENTLTLIPDIKPESIVPVQAYNENDDLDVVHKSVFLPAPAGALNTIVISHPYLWKLYKRLRSLDWDANEFDHSRSKSEFNTASEADIYKIVITILWQWEADSTASRVITEIVNAFWPGTELSAIAQRIAENESLHSHSYSEIVKNCFEDYNDMLVKLRKEIEPLKRLANVARMFGECLQTANDVRSGIIKMDDPRVYRTKLLFFGSMIILERIQFMSSFGVTFTYGDRGSWNSIAKTVQKIAVDELSVHVRNWKYCFRNESRLPEYQAIVPGVYKTLKAIIGEVLASELSNCDLIFKDAPSITHKSKAPVTIEMMKQFVRYSAQNVMDFFDFELPFTRIEVNPLPLMDKWTDINSVQTSPQEELTGNYLLGGFINNLVDGEAYVPSFMKAEDLAV